MTRLAHTLAAIKQRIDRVNTINDIRNQLLADESTLRQRRLYAAAKTLRTAIDELTSLAQADRALIGTLITANPELLAEPPVGVAFNTDTGRFEVYDIPTTT